jgi:hypothetical protein
LIEKGFLFQNESGLRPLSFHQSNLFYMKKFIGILVLACFSFAASAQTVYNYEDCKAPAPTIGKSKTAPAVYGKMANDLNAYFSEKMVPIIQNQRPTGTMELSIAIGADGIPCLVSCRTGGKVGIEPNHIKQIVDGMEQWKPATQGGRAVASNTRLLLTFNVDKVTVKTLGDKKKTR